MKYPTLFHAKRASPARAHTWQKYNANWASHPVEKSQRLDPRKIMGEARCTGSHLCEIALLWIANPVLSLFISPQIPTLTAQGWHAYGFRVANRLAPLAYPCLALRSIVSYVVLDKIYEQVRTLAKYELRIQNPAWDHQGPRNTDEMRFVIKTEWKIVGIVTAIMRKKRIKKLLGWPRQFYMNDKKKITINMKS